MNDTRMSGPSPFGTMRQEAEANAFAFALLMPADWVEREVKKVCKAKGFRPTGERRMPSRADSDDPVLQQ